MPPFPPETDASLASARRTGRRVGALTVLVVAVLFVGSSAAQLISAVFGVGIHPLPEGPPGSSARACAEGVRSLSLRLGDAAPEATPDALVASPAAWDPEGAVYRACAASPGGLDAWAALLRLRVACEQLPRVPPVQINPLRRAVWEHLPADLR